MRLSIWEDIIVILGNVINIKGGHFFVPVEVSTQKKEEKVDETQTGKEPIEVIEAAAV